MSSILSQFSNYLKDENDPPFKLQILTASKSSSAHSCRYRPVNRIATEDQVKSMRLGNGRSKVQERAPAFIIKQNQKKKNKNKNKTECPIPHEIGAIHGLEDE